MIIIIIIMMVIMILKPCGSCRPPPPLQKFSEALHKLPFLKSVCSNAWLFSEALHKLPFPKSSCSHAWLLKGWRVNDHKLIIIGKHWGMIRGSSCSMVAQGLQHQPRSWKSGLPNFGSQRWLAVFAEVIENLAYRILEVSDGLLCLQRSSKIRLTEFLGSVVACPSLRWP